MSKESFVIKNNESNFSIDGMVNPTFVVVGEGAVIMDQIPYEKKDAYKPGSPLGISKGSVTIQFADKKAANNLVVCFFNRIIEDQTNCER